MASQERARKLISMDRNGSLNKIARSKRGDESLSMSLSDDETPQFKVNESVQQSQALPSSFSPQRLKASKLPQEILKSMSENPIDMSGMGSGTSVLDTINMRTNGKLFEQMKKEQKTIVEETKPSVKSSQITQSSTSNSSVDYSLIRMMMEETVKKYVGSLKKTILNESKEQNRESSLRAMKIGDKFSFITDNGDLYEAKLTFIKNINNKGGN